MSEYRGYKQFSKTFDVDGRQVVFMVVPNDEDDDGKDTLVIRAGASFGIVMMRMTFKEDGQAWDALDKTGEAQAAAAAMQAAALEAGDA